MSQQPDNPLQEFFDELISNTRTRSSIKAMNKPIVDHLKHAKVEIDLKPNKAIEGVMYFEVPDDHYARIGKMMDEAGAGVAMTRAIDSITGFNRKAGRLSK